MLLALFVAALLVTGGCARSPGAGASPAAQATPSLRAEPDLNTISALPGAAIPTASATEVDCLTYPGLCSYPLGAPSMNGRLAYLNGTGGVTVIDLARKQVWKLSAAAASLAGWSPSGDYLLMEITENSYLVTSFDGTTLRYFHELSQAPFWAPAVLSPGQDWLAVPGIDGALVTVSFPGGEIHPVLPAGSLGEDGRAVVRWGQDGCLVITPGFAQLERGIRFSAQLLGGLSGNGPNAQNLATWSEDGRCGGALPVSMDYRRDYLQIIDTIPGTVPPLFLAAPIQEGCDSCWNDGASVVTVDGVWGTSVPLGATLLLTSEAYAWNPVQPGLLALAEGGGRFIFENKRLALLDVPAGVLTYINGDDLAAFEPAWSPDGLRLAFAAVGSQPGINGDSVQLEEALSGRSIYVYSRQEQVYQPVTTPRPGDLDGWPRWSRDRHTLLYVRLQIGAHRMQVRAVDLQSEIDWLLFELENAPQTCHRGGCGWERLLSYTRGGAEPQPQRSILAPPPQPEVLPQGPQPGLNTYTHPGYGFSFSFPSEWTLEPDRPNTIGLRRGRVELQIGFRRTQNLKIQPAEVEGLEYSIRSRFSATRLTNLQLFG